MEMFGNPCLRIHPEDLEKAAVGQNFHQKLHLLVDTKWKHKIAVLKITQQNVNKT